MPTTDGSRTASRIPSVWLLGIASGLSPFGMAITVPSLNSISAAFGADFAAVQFVLSAYLFGLAVAQPVCGYLCDRYGRRPVMLTGFLLFAAASLLCALAPSLPLLIVARFLQAAGVSVGTVASRAILRDTRTPERMAEAMSYIAATMGVAPVTAPVFGGLVDQAFGFRWIFVLTAAIGVLVWLRMLMELDETRPADRPPPRWHDWLASYSILLHSPAFIGHTLMFGFVQGSFFAFMAVGASLFATRFNIGAGVFGIIWGLMAVAYVIGATIGARATPVIGSRRVLAIATRLGALGGLGVVAGALPAELSIAGVLLPLGLLMLLAGMITPGAMAGAVVDHPGIAGTASGLSSAIGLVVGGSFSIVAGSIYDGSYLPVAVLMCAAAVLTAISFLIAGRRTGYSRRPAS